VREILQQQPPHKEIKAEPQIAMAPMAEQAVAAALWVLVQTQTAALRVMGELLQHRLFQAPHLDMLVEAVAEQPQEAGVLAVMAEATALQQAPIALPEPQTQVAVAVVVAMLKMVVPVVLEL
jgi:hypothetical protein